MKQILKVIDFSDDQVVFENSDKDIIYWPKNKLPKVPEIGQEITFFIDSIEKKHQAKDIINELLKTNS